MRQHLARSGPPTPLLSHSSSAAWNRMRRAEALGQSPRSKSSDGRTPPWTSPEMSPHSTAVLGRDQESLQRFRATCKSPFRLLSSPRCPAETYRDGEISRGTAGVPECRGLLQGVLHSDRGWLDLCGQCNDHLAPRRLEGPAVAWGNVQLKAEGNGSGW